MKQLIWSLWVNIAYANRNVSILIELRIDLMTLSLSMKFYSTQKLVAFHFVERFFS